MSSSEAERFTLHQTLRTLMPEAVADTLMSHLLPAGWSDVARTSDLDAFRTDTKERFDKIDARFEQMEAKFEQMEAKFEARFDKMDARFEQVETRFEQMEAKFEARFDKMEAKFEAKFEKNDQRLDELASMKRYVITTGIAIIATICAVVSPLWFGLL